MKLDEGLKLRLQFLSRVVKKEAYYLQDTDARLFAKALDVSDLQRIAEDALLAERLDAFVGRFGRLQDTLVDKFLPTLLDAMAETRGAATENLDRAEKLGWLDSTDDWLVMRKLRNQMVHEYIEDLVILCDSLKAGHSFVVTLVKTADQFVAQADRRIAASLSLF
jgi:hypothetical protein